MSASPQGTPQKGAAAHADLDGDLKSGKIDARAYAKKLQARTPDYLRARIQKTRQSNAFLWNALLDPEIRAEYKRLEKEKTGSGTEYLRAISAKRKEEAGATGAGGEQLVASAEGGSGARTFSFANVAAKVSNTESSVAKLRTHILGGGSTGSSDNGAGQSSPKSSSWRVAMLLKDPWIREQYKRREKEKKGSGSTFLRHVAQPGMLAKEKEKEEELMKEKGQILGSSDSMQSEDVNNANDPVVTNLTEGVQRLVSAANKRKEGTNASDNCSDTEKRVNSSLEKINDPSKRERGCCAGESEDACVLM